MRPEDLGELGEPRDHRAFDGMARFCLECLMRNGYPDEQARATCFALVEADARGIFTHGVAGGTGLEEALARTGVTATVDLEAIPRRLPQKYATIGVLDGAGAPGHYTSMLAVEWVRELATLHGLAKVYVFNANHFGAAGIWAEQIARDRAFEAHVTCTSAAAVRLLGNDVDGVDYTRGAAVGGKHRLGTNPDAYCIPHEEGFFTIDMANTELAASLCYKLYKEGLVSGRTKMLKVPNYVADADYRPTLDPNDVLRIRDGKLEVLGSVFPAGGLRGYKGQIMLQRVEADHCFGGGPIRAVEVGSTTADRRVSHTFEAQAIDFLYATDQALGRMSQLVKDWTLHGGPSTRMPGERSHLAREYALQNGIPYSAEQIQTLERCGKMAGVDVESVPSSFKPYPRNLFTK